MALDPKTLKERAKGVIHLVMTHFQDDGDLDLKSLKKSVQHVVTALKGNDAVFLTTGSTGEFYSLTEEETDKVIQTVVDTVGGAFPVIAGTGRAGTTPTILASQRAQKLGVDGVMVVNPFYHLVTLDGLYRHHRAVAESVDVGIMIYNNPVTSKMWIPPELMAKLSKIKNIVLDKENSSNVVSYYWMQRAVKREDMEIVCGLGQLFYPFEALFHAPGYVTELANFAPQLAVDLDRAAKRRDADKLTALMDRIALYHQFITECAKRRGALPTVLSPHISIPDLPFYQSVCKKAMELVGLPGGIAREPMENITEEEKGQLKEVLRKMEVL